MLSRSTPTCTAVDAATTPQPASTVQLRNPRTIGGCPRCGREARLTPGGWRCFAGEPVPAEPLRPAGHGAGLDGPVCPERLRPQFPDGDYRVRMCARCGRITARLDTDGAAWCGGMLPGATAERKRHLRVVAA